MQTNADIAGVEKLAVSKLRPEIGCRPKYRFAATEINSDYTTLLEPHGVFFVKGWTRAVCANTVLLCAFDNADFFQVGERFLQHCFCVRVVWNCYLSVLLLNFLQFLPAESASRCENETWLHVLTC